MSEESLFHSALQIPRDARSAFLDEACGSDAALRARIEALLAAHEGSGSFLLRPPADPPPPADAPRAAGDAVSEQIGPYRLLAVIGEGGMGCVYLAEQLEPVQRRVALKLIRPGMDSRRVVARFEAERQTLALMDHPCIAKVLDAGTTDSHRPYFVMELVEGVPITRFCDEQHLSLRERLGLFAEVCRAVQHAHSKGIIHRDLKPSNVLVARYDGRAVPKVIDFGVAKATGPRITEGTLLTELGTVVGTLEYMSPEQAELDPLDVDTRSDIYSLGVLLYELLTGSTPLTRERLKEKAVLEALRIVRDEDPPRPSTRLASSAERAAIARRRAIEPERLAGILRGELDWVVMRCLEKDRERRYESAASLARDVRAFLDHQPLQACPPSLRYRFVKLARRKKGMFAMAAVATLGLLSVLASLVAGNVLVWRERNRTQIANERLSENLLLAFEALDEVHMRLAEVELPREPARREAHLELLRKALDFYERFASQNNTDPKVRRVQADALRKAFRILHALDEHAGAESAGTRGIELYRQLLCIDPEDTGARYGLALALINLALMESRRGLHEEAETHAQEGLELLSALVAAAGAGDLEYLRDLALASSNLGVQLNAVGRMGDARAALQRAIEHFDQIELVDPDDPEVALGRAQATVNLGLVTAESGRFDEAEVLYTQAIAILEGSQHAFAWTREWRRLAGVVHMNLSTALRGMGRFQDAEAAGARAIDVQDALVAEFPSVPEFRGDLALSFLTWSDALRTLGRHQEAEGALRGAQSVLEELVAEHPGVQGYRRDHALSIYGLACVQALQGHLDEALQSCMRAVEMQESLHADHPALPAYRHELARSHRVRAEILDLLGRADEVGLALQRARELDEVSLAGEPGT